MFMSHYQNAELNDNTAPENAAKFKYLGMKVINLNYVHKYITNGLNSGNFDICFRIICLTSS